MKDLSIEEKKALEAVNSDDVCTGKEPIGGKGRRRAKRKARKTNNCPYCDDPSCKLTLNSFLNPDK